MEFPKVNEPEHLPELRLWMLRKFRPGGSLEMLDGRFIHRTMQTAQLWWVEEETCHLIADSAPTLPEDLVLRWEDLPTAAGFAVFAHDIEGTDAYPGMEDKTIRISAMCWGPVQLPDIGTQSWSEGGVLRPGLGIGMFTRHDLHMGLSADDLQRSSTVMAMLSQDIFGPGAKPGAKAAFSPEGREGTIFSYIGRTDWLSGQTCDAIILDNPHGAHPTTARSMAEDRRLIAALWAITKTSIVSSVQAKVPRPVRRRSEREKMSAEVQILRLGGPKSTHASPVDKSPVEWKHSWIVRPHWVWQPFGPRAEGKRKLILRGPFKKGPEEMPLLGADRVWKVVPPKERNEDS